MRNVLGFVVAAATVLASAEVARAQVAAGEGVMAGEYPGLTPGLLPPSVYAASMLPPSPTYPWVMVPRFGTAATEASGLAYGNRFSPYGLYSRYPYWATAPFPAVARPPARFDKPCGHPRCRDCR